MPPRIVLTISPWTIGLEDIGQPMNVEFQTLYQELLALGYADWTRHDQTLFHYLDRHTSVPQHDSYFNNLTPYWQILQKAGRYADAVNLWHERIGAAIQWEKTHSPNKVHKGTPLYFLGVTHTLVKSLERGFLAMHRALDEDARTRGSPTPDTPAYAFVTIDSSKADQYFRPWVADLAAYVESKLDQFRHSRNGTLTFAGLQSRFLRNPDLREEAFYFASSSAKVKEYEGGPVRVEAESQFGSIVELRVLFDICVVLDRIIGSKIRPGSWKFIERVAWLFRKTGGRPSIRNELGIMTGKVVNGAPLEQIISDLLDLKYLFRGNRRPTRVEADLSLAYLLRNQGAHVLEALPTVHDRFSQLLNAILGSLFLAVQTLLP